MGRKVDRTSEPAEAQVFELTMDNPEDQDELNRRFRKPGEPDPCPAPSKEDSKAEGCAAEKAAKKKDPSNRKS